MTGELDRLFIKYGTDKSSKHHNYSPHYESHFKELKSKKMKMLILGVGGYEFPDRGGGDLKAFSDYFPNSKIYGLDMYDKSGIKLPARTKIFQGSQADGDFLTEIMKDVGILDVIIDDASHMNSLTIQSFRHLFPWLRSGGIYVMEDVESSWWEKNWDGKSDFKDFNSETSINFCRWLTNNVNAKHVPDFKDNYGIDSIHFYENMVVIIKK